MPEENEVIEQPQQEMRTDGAPPAPPPMIVQTTITSELAMAIPADLKYELIDMSESGDSPVLEALRKKHADDDEFVIAALEWWLARGLRRMIPVILAPLDTQVHFAEIKGRYDPVELPEGASILEVTKNGESAN